MKTLFKGFICFLALCLAAPVLAGSIKEYTADMVDVKSGKVVGKYAVTEKKMRMESTDEDDGDSLVIIRMDQGKVYVMQEDKTYIDIPIKGDKVPTPEELAGMMGGGDLFKPKREKLGTETVSGYKAEKFRVTHTIEMMGQKHTSVHHEWLAKEFDIPVRIENEGNIAELRNIKVGTPAASLFEIPAGYKKNTEMEEMMKQMQQMQQLQKQ